jgi:PAS domain S-box-containing protein
MLQNDELQRQQAQLEEQNEKLVFAQEDLQRERQRYAELYEQAPVGYCTVNDAGLILQINRAAATLLGRPLSTLVRQALTKFIYHDDQDSYYHVWRKLIATGAPQSVPLRMTQKAGTLVWVLLQATMDKDQSGVPVCRIVLSDITALKQAD